MFRVRSDLAVAPDICPNIRAGSPAGPDVSGEPDVCGENGLSRISRWRGQEDHSSLVSQAFHSTTARPRGLVGSQYGLWKIL